MNAGLPVLVSSTGEPSAPARAIGIIRDEHRSLAAVMHAWMHALAAARQAGVARRPGADARRSSATCSEFPLELHHPKEDEHLFRRLRERTTSCDAELDELERQHERDQPAASPRLRGRSRRSPPPTAPTACRRRARSRTTVDRYADFLWDHMGREEGVILPAAQRHLLADDWAAIDAAFAENRDPNFDGDADRRISPAVRAHRQPRAGVTRDVLALSDRQES